MSLAHLALSFRAITALAAIALTASPVAAQRVRQISDFHVTHIGIYAVDDAGSVVFFTSTIDPFGTNPDGLWQIFKKSLPGGALVQVTALDSDATNVSVSDDGATILFLSNADPLDTNSDGSVELFLADSGGGSLVQLTDHPAGGGEAYAAVISGDGGRALFTSDGDPAGLNHLGFVHLFVIDTDGTGVVQLTRRPAAGDPYDLAISDDGGRIIFSDDRDHAASNPDGSRELFKVLANGSAMRQVTTDSEVYSAALNGQGTTIVYHDSAGMYSTPWDPVNPLLLDTSGGFPSITDDGARVYYFDTSLPRAIHWVPASGGTPVTVWETGDAWRPVIAGGGSRLLFQVEGEGVHFTTDPDATQLLATNAGGLSAEQVIDVGEWGGVMPFEMTADGRWIVFPWGSGPYYEGMDLFLADTDSDTVTQLTNRAGAYDPAIGDDGSIIIFHSRSDLIDDDCDISTGGGTYRISPDGSGLQQLIPEPVASCLQSWATHPMISGDGSTIVHQDADDPAGTSTGSGAELYSVASGGGTVWQVTQDDDSLYKNPRIDGSGTWVVYESGSDITGWNPDGNWEVFRIRSDGTSLEQLTDNSGNESFRPDISANGELIVYASNADPLFTNEDRNFEIFLYDVTGPTLEQLTDTSDGTNDVPRISPNGAYVAFHSTSTWFDTAGPVGAYRIELGTDELMHVSAGSGYVIDTVRNNVSIDVDNDGNVAFAGFKDLVGLNKDLSTELWLSEFDELSSFGVGAEDPTLLSWDPLPWAIRYDVIRGDVASLSPGGGGTVDLGTVACLENNSEDGLTDGNEDAVQPSPGQVLFYLYRGSRGDLVGPGSYGQGSSDGERVPSAGDCPNAD